MLNRTRVIAAGLLMLALASGPLRALPSESQTRLPSPTQTDELIAVVWEWIVDVLGPRPEASAREQSTGAKGDQGSQLDPDGNH